MHKVFFKGRIEVREKYQRFGYNTNRQVKLGSENSPLTLAVNSEQRKKEIEQILLENSLVASIEINAGEQENIIQLDTILKRPKTQTNSLAPNRNDPCSCGSGKKFKKCCALHNETKVGC
jgi:SWIM/SEC-C metal-binding protein